MLEPVYTLHAQTAADTLYEAAQVPDFAQRNTPLLVKRLGSYGYYGYPLEAFARRVEGVVRVSLVVGADGRTRNLRLLTQLGGGCADTALAVARRLPWQAGQVAGRPVAVRYTLDVPFAPPGWYGNGHPNSEEIQFANKYAARLGAAISPSEAGVTEPRFPGGSNGAHIDAYFTGTVRPAVGIYASASGQPLVGFTVEATGRVRHPRILASVCPPCDSAVLAAARRMPRWTPARRNGHPITRFVQTYVNYMAVVQGGRTGSYQLPLVPARDSAEVLPAYPGGDAALLALVRKTYPYRTDPGAASLVLLLGGIVQPDGRFTDLQLSPLLAGLFRPQLTALVAAMPPWQPGRVGGQPVAVGTFLLLPMPSSAAELKQLAAEKKARATTLAQPDTRVYDYVEQMPRTAGGQAVEQAIRQALVPPPGLGGGRVVVKFVLMPTGRVQQLQLVSATTPALGQAALAAIRRLPALVPGRQNGRAVAVRYTVPMLVP